jgi:hypothetical protein
MGKRIRKWTDERGIRDIDAKQARVAKANKSLSVAIASTTHKVPTYPEAQK